MTVGWTLADLVLILLLLVILVFVALCAPVWVLRDWIRERRK